MTAQLTLAVSEIAQALGMSESAIYDRVRRGEIPNVGVGRSVRVPRRWLDAHLAAAGVERETVTTVRQGTFS